MYSFAIQDQIGKVGEYAFEDLLTAAQISFSCNPANGTSNPSRADYDYVIDVFLIEVKFHPAAEQTGNVAIETDILLHSKSDFFVIMFPAETPGYVHAQVLDRSEIQTLLKASKLTDTGRFPKFRPKP
jgi:hypothetical protein